MSEYAKARILVAEDDTLNQRVIQMILKGLGCQCDIVSNGKQALTAYNDNVYHLILMDYEMPEMNGLEATKEIRSQEKTRGKQPVPIIALTGHSREEEKNSCLTAGMNAYVSKPLTSEGLRQILEKWLNTAV